MNARHTWAFRAGLRSRVFGWSGTRKWRCPHLHGAGGLLLATTVVAIGLTTIANMGTKATIAWTTGGAAIGWPVLHGYAAAMTVGAMTVAWAVLT